MLACEAFVSLEADLPCSSHEHVDESTCLVLASQVVVGLFREEVLGKQIDKCSIDEQTRRDGVEDTDDNETEGAVGVVRAAGEKTDGLTDGSGGTESYDQSPRLPASVGVRYSCDTGSETETFEHLVEDDGDEQDDEAFCCDGNGHTNENGVEENTTFDKSDLERLLFEDQWIHRPILDILIEVRNLRVGTLLLRVAWKGGHCAVDHIYHLFALTDVLLVEDNEPRWHLRSWLHLIVVLGEREVLGGICVLDPALLVIADRKHSLLRIVAVPPLHGVAHCCLDACGRGTSVELLASCAAVGMTTSLCVQPHLDHKQDKK